MKRTLPWLIGLALVQPLCAQTTLLTGLVGYWNFDEGAGTTVDDLSGNGNNGTLSNPNGGGAWTTGHFGGAYYFPGVTGSNSTRVVIPNSASLQITSAITVAAWVRVDNINSDAPILAKEGPNAGDLSYWFGAFGLGTEGGGAGNFGLLLDSDGSQPWTIYDRSQGSLTAGQWVHLASTWDGSQIVNYLNGVAVGTASFTGTINSASTEFLGIGVNSGYYNQGNATAFTGAIDDLYLYDRALSAPEIQQLMASPIPEPAATAATIGALAGAAVVVRRRWRTGAT